MSVTGPGVTWVALVRSGVDKVAEGVRNPGVALGGSVATVPAMLVRVGVRVRVRWGVGDL